MEVIKNCQTCGHRSGGQKYDECDQCQKTGLYCATSRLYPNMGCDKNFSGGVERPKPWFIRLFQ
jgi:hypothetical protein